MRRLILIKHSLPAIDPHTPSNEWRLSEEGRRLCAPLAEQLAHYKPAALVSSLEPKAVETAALVAQHLGLTYETAEGLHEHRRTSAGWLSQEAFDEAVANFFARPGYLAFGEETAAQVQERVLEAIDGVLAKYPSGNVAIVSHGTAIANFVATMAGWQPFALWKQLGLPSFVILSLPGFEVSVIVENVAPDRPAEPSSAPAG